MVVEKRNMLIK